MGKTGKRVLIFESYYSQEIADIIDEIAGLRIRVFRDFPYLYDGTAEYEANYLSRYTTSPSSLVVVARDPSSGQAVGATTCQALIDEMDEVKAPFLKLHYPLQEYLYLGESVLLPQYRGAGVGARFFDEREGHGKKLHKLKAAFCAVERPTHHPLRPPNYHSLDRFWIKRGYTKKSELEASYPWKDIDEEQESEKKLIFWTREL